jgi:cyclopropane fatty-acyl-phospholipid synthase-like methyltransferase
VLDLGCGNGEPILVELLSRGFAATGVDFSHEQIVRARGNCPEAHIMEVDMMAAECQPRSFDGAVSYDAIWHLPRPEHATLFAKLRSWLVDGAPILLTLADVDLEAARRSGIPVAQDGHSLFTDLLGAPMFYDGWALSEYLAMLQDAGFSVVAHDTGPGPLIILGRAYRT